MELELSLFGCQNFTSHIWDFAHGIRGGKSTEIREKLATECNADASVATVWTFLNRFGLTFKKTAHASERHRTRSAKCVRRGSTTSST